MIYTVYELKFYKFKTKKIDFFQIEIAKVRVKLEVQFRFSLVKWTLQLHFLELKRDIEFNEGIMRVK